jgi:hypothetical protein
MPEASPSLLVFLDLGDAFSKALAVGDARRERVRYPSVVASRLLSSGDDMTQLRFDESEPLPRLAEFDPARFPRWRSYPRAESFVERASRSPPGAGARFAGEIAAIYGADRRLLGHDPSQQTIDALVHKALILLCKGERCDAEVVLIVDSGQKARRIQRYAEAPPRSASVELRTVGRKARRQLELRFLTRVVDAADCLAAAAPASLGIAPESPWLAIDIGFLRTKLAIVSAEGCEHQEQLEGVGTSALVGRILRDEQEQGLVEDEFALILALEGAEQGSISVSGRRFSISRPLVSVGRELVDDLTRGAERVIVEHYQRRGEACRAVAILGGGAAWLGEALEQRLTQANLGLARIWASAEPSFLLAEGARKLANRTSDT